MSRRVTITAERGNGVWVLETYGVGVSQVKRLDQAVEEMTEAIEAMMGVSIDDVDVQVVPVLPEAYADEVRQAERAREAAREATASAAVHSRRAARTLADAGLSTRDIGTVMGVSHQRAAQLLAG